ncbi:LigA [Burkholderia ambifaria IOP40-10]|uniref:LigA n=1 Tax=Burkholderia ambifaria IOP40-10 TaxID=396596 RepID=B1FNG7_9BURK|nr:LigA [Burkholderia ambifaria IOP40-10]
MASRQDRRIDPGRSRHHQHRPAVPGDGRRLDRADRGHPAHRETVRREAGHAPLLRRPGDGAGARRVRRGQSSGGCRAVRGRVRRRAVHGGGRGRAVRGGACAARRRPGGMGGGRRRLHGRARVAGAESAAVPRHGPADGIAAHVADRPGRRPADDDRRAGRRERCERRQRHTEGRDRGPGRRTRNEARACNCGRGRGGRSAVQADDAVGQPGRTAGARLVRRAAGASRSADRALHDAHPEIEGIGAGVPPGAGRQPCHGRLPVFDQGDAVSDRRRSRGRFAAVGYRRQRVHRFHDGLRRASVRPHAGLHPAPGHPRVATSARTGRALEPRRRSGRALCARHRSRSRGFLEHRHRGGHDRDAARARRDRARQDRDVHAFVSRPCRRHARRGERGRRDGNHRPRRAVRFGREHGPARLRQRRRARGHSRDGVDPRRRDGGAGAEPQPVPAARRVPQGVAPHHRGGRNRADLRRNDHRLPRPSGRLAGHVRGPGRSRDIRQDHRRRPAAGRHRRFQPLHGRHRRRHVDLRRPLVPRRRPHRVRRHLLPVPARDGGRAGRAGEDRTGGAGAAGRAQRTDRANRRNVECVFRGGRGADQGHVVRLDVPLRIHREPRPVLLSHARKGHLHLGVAHLLPLHRAYGSRYRTVHPGGEGQRRRPAPGRFHPASLEARHGGRAERSATPAVDPVGSRSRRIAGLQRQHHPRTEWPPRRSRHARGRAGSRRPARSAAHHADAGRVGPDRASVAEAADSADRHEPGRVARPRKPPAVRPRERSALSRRARAPGQHASPAGDDGPSHHL